MKFNFYVNENKDEHIDFHIKKITPELQKIANQLQNCDLFIWGIDDKMITPLRFMDIIRLYTANNKVYSDTLNHKEYVIKYRLYQLDDILSDDFIQISNSEIVNFKFIDHLELTLNNTIKIIFINHDYSYASRRYVKKIKKRLGI